MVLLKRKPVLHTPLPSLSTVLQPVPSAPLVPTDSPSTEAPKSKSKHKPEPTEANEDASAPTWIPPDGKDDEEQLDKLLFVFREDTTNGAAAPVVKGRKSGVTKMVGPADLNGLIEKPNGEVDEQGQVGTTWRVWDRECFYIPETGEIFTDYE
jgi:hypothetical protein